MTRIPFAIWTPATFDPAYPQGKHYPLRSLARIKYQVNHDARGYRSYLKQGQRPGEQASWMFSNLTDGVLLQHYELEQPTWTSGTQQANEDGVAVEHENEIGPWGVPQPFALTPSQVATDRRLNEYLHTVCPNLKPPIFMQGFREHKELTGGATTCPNGRIQPLYESYSEPEPIEEDDDMILLQGPTRGIWIVGAGGKRGLGQPETDAYIRAGVTLRAASDADIDAIEDAAVTSGAGPAVGTKFKLVEE